MSGLLSGKCEQHIIALDNDTCMLWTEDDVKQCHHTSRDERVPWTATSMLDARKTWLTLFSFCPQCGAAINWRAIKARMKTFEKRYEKTHK